jgi:hypothetical protein
MTKRTEKKSMKMALIAMTLCLSLASLFSASGTYASVNSIESSSLTTVRGTVRFEKRNTIVPMGDNLIAEALDMSVSFCDGDGCPRPSAYWAVIVDDGRRQYEMHQAFAVGAKRAPMFIQINGVMLRPGSEIALEGSIESISESYGIISDVKSISVISNPKLPGQGMTDSIYGMEGPGWNCASNDYSSQGVNALVWYGRQSVMSNESFHIRVVVQKMIDTNRVHQGVTDINNVQLMQVGGSLVYQGAVDDTAATLAIQRNSPMVRNYPSTLSVSSARGGMGVRMLCSPVSTLPPTSF